MDFIDRHLKQSTWIFRGVADAEKPSDLFRKIGRNGERYDPWRSSGSLFANFKRQAPPARQHAGDERIGTCSPSAQHHGLPTKASGLEHQPARRGRLCRCEQARGSEPPASLPFRLPTRSMLPPSRTPFSCNRVGAILPTAVAPRIVAQRGLFTIHPDPTDAMGLPINMSHHPPPSETYDIEARHRAFFKTKLFQLAIDASGDQCRSGRRM